MSLKRRAKGAWTIWRIVVIVIISFLLIPLALAHHQETEILLWIMIGSLLLYIALATVGGRSKGMLRRYLRGTGIRFLLAGIALGCSLLLSRQGSEDWAKATIVVAAILYAFAIQRVSFLRVVGL